MKTFIIHVSTAFKRKEHILEQLEGKLTDYTFILEADKDKLTTDFLTTHFKNDMLRASNLAASSCASKHLIAYRQFLTSGAELALILEDDIILEKNFTLFLPLFAAEIKERKLENLLVSIEDSSLTYVPRSLREKGTYLYPAKKGRMAGAYIIDRKAANELLTEVALNRCGQPIDWFHNDCAARNIIQFYWSHPTVSIQGSLNGKIKSTIDQKKTGTVREIVFTLQRYYKRLLFCLR